MKGSGMKQAVTLTTKKRVAPAIVVVFAVFTALLAAVVLALAANPARAQAEPFITVDRPDDTDVRGCTTAPDDCTLRGAINYANSHPNGAGSDQMGVYRRVTAGTRFTRQDGRNQSFAACRHGP